MVETQTVKQRLILFIKYLDIGQGKFEANCGLANGYVNNIRRSVSPEKLQRITRQYPELNASWLITGEGDMLRPNQSVNDINESQLTAVNVHGNDIKINAPDRHDPEDSEQSLATIARIVDGFQDTTNEYISLLKKSQEQLDRVQEQMNQRLSKSQEQIDRLLSLLESRS